MGNVIDNATVFKFVIHFDSECRPEDRQERYVVALTEDEAINKFSLYLTNQQAKGFMKPYCYTFYPTVEIDYVIV